MAAVAPMELVMRGEPVAIPLKCILCPRKPNFSDVSHLLTHISSKAHLSHRFKIELRSHKEREAQQTLDVYNEWYDRHRIGSLLAERMSAKEQKKSTKRGRSSNAVSHNKSRTSSRADEDIKIEPGDYEDSPPLIAGHWHASVHSHSMRRDYYDSTGYETPVLRRQRSDYSIPGTPDQMKRKYERWPSETDTATSGLPSEQSSEIVETLEDDNDPSKQLKGIKYPGMGIFDSASELQKRRRNQRKDESVLRQMQVTSFGIEPNEVVWNEVGEYQRTRDIYASPSVEGTPERDLEEEPQKKRKPRRATAARFTAAARPRQTRSSTKNPRNNSTAKKKSNRTEELSHNPMESDVRRTSSHSHGSVESYDVFHDHPQLSPLGSESPLKDSGYDFRRRPALQPLSTNISMVSPVEKPINSVPMSYFPSRDNTGTTFPSHPPVPNNSYFRQQQNLSSGNYNPLFQTRNTYFNPYNFTNYGSDAKPPTTGFQSVNAMNQNLGSMSFGSFSTPYTADSPHERGHHDFDI
ncbi:hypothetical protein B0T17DRAFT_635673 [Bombardia bombarda]|uniref:Uncharacterized protein n=1 Tax=Bombardia bombarda TaxID=252184 RepID=A0AA40CAB5_9PEZI|nr:hypothetical protein B0T17DRAFT_635673 [Bombardia bombarda]